MGQRCGIAVAVVALVAGCVSACGNGGSPRVRFIAPRDGAVVTSPVSLRMAATGITIEPAGPIRPQRGHFHVMVDVGCLRPGAFVEMHTDGFEHFGDGRTTGTLELSTGEHTLCLQVGDGAHVTFAPTHEIKVTVK